MYKRKSQDQSDQIIKKQTITKRQTTVKKHNIVNPRMNKQSYYKISITNNKALRLLLIKKIYINLTLKI